MASMTISGGAKFEARLKEIADRLGQSKHVRVGFLEGSTYPDGTSVPLVAALNEWGRPSVGQPPRPFMRTTVSENSGDWPRYLEHYLKETDYDLDKSLLGLGNVIKEQIQGTITSFTSPPLAPSTIKKKGFDKPLIKSKNMLDSVDCEVVDGAEED